MKRSSPSSPPHQNDSIQPARSHYLDFRVGRAAAATAAAPSIIGGGGGGVGVSALSLPSPYGNNTTTTSSCFANFGNGCSFGSTDSCIGWGEQGTRRTDTASNPVGAHPVGNAAAGGGGGGGDDASLNTTASSSSSTKNEEDDPTRFIANEMNRLSLPERELGYEDIHGVSNPIEETPEFISKSLQQLEIEIEKIPNKPAYELAKTLPNGKEYVSDTKLRIMFLRATRFHIQQAAKRFMKWLTWKLELFGRDKLCQHRITMNDLTDGAKVVVESGLVQLLPARDSKGRSILYFSYYYTNLFAKCKLDSLQMIFYIIMNIAIDDEISQKNGMVYIGYAFQQNQNQNISHHHDTTTTFVDVDDDTAINTPNNSDFIWKISNLCSCLPIRLVAMHYLTNKSNSSSGSAMMMSYALSWLTKSLSSENNPSFLSRLRIHIGSHIECEYALTSFGIPTYYLPVITTNNNNNCELKITNHKKWIQRQLIKEDEIQRQHNQNGNNTSYIFPGIELPNNYDVLLGSGKPFRDHPGNKRLLELLRCYLEEYNLAPRPHGRTIVARKVMNEIKYNSSSGGTTTGSSGYRFLKLRSTDSDNKSGWWEEVTDENIILERIRNGFRNTRRPK